MWRWPWQKPPEPVKPPTLGGTRAPAELRRIDFSRPHGFRFRFAHDRAAPAVFRRRVLIGFTTPEDDGAMGGPGIGECAHNRRLDLRREDDRLVYVPRDHLLYIEESGPTA